MRLLSLTAVPWLLTSLLLTGCALAPGQQAEPEPTLTPDAFEARIAHLEQNLGQRCDAQLQWQAQQDLRQGELQADVREVGGLLRRLRSDIARLEQRDDEPVIIAADCNDRAGDVLEGKELVGRSEWIGLPDIGTYLKARVDSGASTSSLSATEITRFERDGENWVRFKLGLTDDDVAVDDVRDEWIEAPVVRRVRILQAAGTESRPVVSLIMSLGAIHEPVEFTLSDRTHLNYPVLLGRRFLMDLAVIDVAETYLHPRPEFPGGRPADEAHEDEIDDQDEDER
ncbi:ATP-dependent zinc protease [Halomonas campisalis]|uniref:ATP-dependent zinc protease n=1 Tax=Billgrantia campisalis TaxID=74661 RepID=A0ABS9P5T5_9GAMM|nr:RimK/LysX family protein [Halomonas campisalis]MCG6657124.1 ATP-dependent zinc protease [Halomonas campisalis]MDR5862309.1 RimK/LysX family protein [Halomonas campisalis]